MFHPALEDLILHLTLLNVEVNEAEQWHTCVSYSVLGQGAQLCTDHTTPRVPGRNPLSSLLWDGTAVVTLGDDLRRDINNRESAYIFILLNISAPLIIVSFWSSRLNLESEGASYDGSTYSCLTSLQKWCRRPLLPILAIVLWSTSPLSLVSNAVLTSTRNCWLRT